VRYTYHDLQRQLRIGINFIGTDKQINWRIYSRSHKPWSNVWDSFNLIHHIFSRPLRCYRNFQNPLRNHRKGVSNKNLQEEISPRLSGRRLRNNTKLYLYIYFKMSCVYCCSCLVCVVIFVYLFYYMCIAIFTLDARLLARSQYSEGPVTGHLVTDFSWFPCVYKQTLRWFPRFQVATTRFSCRPPDLNLLVTNFIFCIYVK